jgi:hypothetical protein
MFSGTSEKHNLFHKLYRKGNIFIQLDPIETSNTAFTFVFVPPFSYLRFRTSVFVPPFSYLRFRPFIILSGFNENVCVDLLGILKYRQKQIHPIRDEMKR